MARKISAARRWSRGFLLVWKKKSNGNVQTRSSQKGIKQHSHVLYYIYSHVFDMFIFGRKKVLEWQIVLLHKEVTTAFGPCHPNWYFFFRVLFCDEVDGANPANQLKCLKHWSLCRILPMKV